MLGKFVNFMYFLSLKSCLVNLWVLFIFSALRVGWFIMHSSNRGCAWFSKHIKYREIHHDKMADGASFVITSLKQIFLIACRLSEKETNLPLCFVCGINEAKSAAFIESLARKSLQIVLLEYKFMLWKLLS